MIKFNFRIDGGPEQVTKLKSGVYRYAAAAIPALLDILPPFDITIWAGSVTPEYGPYHYRVREDEFGRIIVEHLMLAHGDNVP